MEDNLEDYRCRMQRRCCVDVDTYLQVEWLACSEVLKKFCCSCILFDEAGCGKLFLQVTSELRGQMKFVLSLWVRNVGVA